MEALAIHSFAAVDLGRMSILMVVGAWSDHVIVEMADSVMLGSNHLSTRK